MKLINFTIIKLTIGLIVGIIIAFYKPITASLAIITTICFISITLVIKLLLKKTPKGYLFGVFTYITIIFIGILTTTLHNEREASNHYSQVKSINQSKDLITFRIREVLKPNLYHDKYIIDILKINSKTVSGKSILNVEKDSLVTQLKVDDILATTEPFKTIKEPLNPEQFNYKNYLAKQYIDHQITTRNNYLFSILKKKHTVYGHAEKLRDHIKKRLESYDFKPDELAIINALILGQRHDISSIIYDNYVKAGAIHILAVSGLHVGIILLLITALLKPLEHLKNGRVFKIIIILVFLWCFAIIAGLSASVTRAVTMFSIVTIGTHLKRPVNIYNTLAISIFVLLLFKPLFLFDVGFQLSYSAVIAIVSIQPLLVPLWQPKWFVFKTLWQVFTVSIAAQLGVLPLSLFYFHQFPGLFFLSNLVIIPCLGFILGLGILVIILALLNSLPELLSTFYGFIINYLNQFIKWISLQDAFIFEAISFNGLQLITSYFLIIAFVRCIIKVNYKKIVFLLVSIALFQGAFINNSFNKKASEFIIFHKGRETIIAQRKNTLLKFYSNIDTSILKTSFRDYKVANNINRITIDSLSPIYKIKDRYLLVIDDNGIYNVKQFHPDYIVLINTPKINLNRMIDSIKPSLIIANGSNYKSQVLKWKATCKNKKVPFHYTYEKGALVLDND